MKYSRENKQWCPDAGSNHGHADFQSAALPTELSGHARFFNRSAWVYNIKISSV